MSSVLSGSFRVCQGDSIILEVIGIDGVRSYAGDHIDAKRAIRDHSRTLRNTWYLLDIAYEYHLKYMGMYEDPSLLICFVKDDVLCTALKILKCLIMPRSCLSILLWEWLSMMRRIFVCCKPILPFSRSLIP